MKRLLLTVGSILMIAGFVFAAEAATKVYAAAESAKHVGEVATVVGTVESVRVLDSGMTLVNLDGRYPNQALTIVIRPRAAQTVGDLNSFRGKRVRVSGKISEYHGKPQIEITSPTQLAEAKE